MNVEDKLLNSPELQPANSLVALAQNYASLDSSDFDKEELFGDDKSPLSGRSNDSSIIEVSPRIQVNHSASISEKCMDTDSTEVHEPQENEKHTDPSPVVTLTAPQTERTRQMRKTHTNHVIHVAQHPSSSSSAGDDTEQEMETKEPTAREL